MVFLDLGCNELKGSIPSSAGNLRLLEMLYLHENELSGFIPSSIGNLTRLTVLKLRNGTVAFPYQGEFVLEQTSVVTG